MAAESKYRQSDAPARRKRPQTASNRHDFGFFRHNQPVDFRDVFIGELLDVIACTTFVVLRDFLVLYELLQLLVGVATQITYSNLGVFAFALDNLRQLAAAFFGQRGHGDADLIALVRVVQAQIRITDRLFHHRNHLLFPHLHADRTGVDQRHVRDLRNGHARAVVIHLDMVQQARVGTARTDLCEIVLERIDRLLHLLIDALPNVSHTHLSLRTFIACSAGGGGAVPSERARPRPFVTARVYTWTSVPSSSP